MAHGSAQEILNSKDDGDDELTPDETWILSQGPLMHQCCAPQSSWTLFHRSPLSPILGQLLDGTDTKPCLARWSVGSPVLRKCQHPALPSTPFLSCLQILPWPAGSHFPWLSSPVSGLCVLRGTACMQHITEIMHNWSF